MQTTFTLTDGLALLLALALPLAVGALGGAVTSRSVRTWYRELAKPSFNPPAAVFGPVWTLLYVLMGVASWLVWRHGWEEPSVRRALGVYLFQLGLNLTWSLLFFGLRRIFAALVELVLLVVAVAVTVVLFARVDWLAGLLLWPYLSWSLFATVLNLSIWWLNPQPVTTRPA